MARIQLLGGVRAVSEHGETLDVGPAKSQAVLAALALSTSQPVPEWRLVELVWGAHPPRTATRTLHSYLARLRQNLGPEAISRTGPAYRLEVPAEAVDVLRFQHRIDAGEVDAALAEWTGFPLGGLAVPGLNATVDSLVEQWLGALETDLTRRAETQPATAIGHLIELTRAHPFREGLWAALMTALYRTGRQADALAAYRTARRHLIDHLGVEPGPRLRHLEAAVLSQDARLTSDEHQDRDEHPHGWDAGRPAGAPTHRPTGTVTFAFTEVVDAAQWWATRGPAMAVAMRAHDIRVRQLTRAHSGHVFATGGGSFGVAFHRATDAVAWASDLQADDVPATPVTASGPDAVRLRLRIGLHTGEAEERDQGYFGPAVNLAAGLAGVGAGGQILLSAGTAAVLDRPDLRDLGRYRLDGVAGRPRVHQIGPHEYGPLRTEDSRPGNLPRRLGPLIGREPDLAVIGAALADGPVVTLIGAGGIGKTRLALAAAQRVAVEDGAWLIDLAEIASPDDVPRAVAGTLGITEAPGQTLSRSVVTALRSRQTLLVLDNCEHVVAGVAALVQALAEDCPQVQILATSREALGLAHGYERIITVGPLEPSGPGVELFQQRATSGRFDPAADRPRIAEICRRLDGVPLAIELAAARTSSLSPAELLTRLDDHLRLLVSDRRTGVERHRTLRATVQWSYSLIGPDEQILLQRLSIFVGPFDLAAAAAIDADPSDTDTRLGALVDRSMVVVESGPFGRRFRLLETIRQFAAEHLSAQDAARTADRHARWCAEQVARIQQLCSGPGELEGVARLDELWPNLRAAFGWACDTGNHRLAHAVVRPVVTEIVRRSRMEIGDWVERLLAITPPDDPEVIVFGLTWAAQRYKLGQDPSSYERLTDRYGELEHPLIRHARASAHLDFPELLKWTPAATAALRRQGEHDLAEQFELDVGAALVFGGQFAEGDAVVTDLVDRYRRNGPATQLNLALMVLGYSAEFQGRTERAAALFAEAIAVPIPDRTHSPNRAIEARTAFRQGEPVRAFRILRSHIDHLLDTGNLQAVCFTSVEFITMTALDRPEDAARLLHHLDGVAPYWAPLVADARHQIGGRPAQSPARLNDLGDRAALEHMRAVLTELITRG